LFLLDVIYRIVLANKNAPGIIQGHFCWPVPEHTSNLDAAFSPDFQISSTRKRVATSHRSSIFPPSSPAMLKKYMKKQHGGIDSGKARVTDGLILKSREELNGIRNCARDGGQLDGFHGEVAWRDLFTSPLRDSTV
jgi:hypothetical protein